MGQQSGPERGDARRWEQVRDILDKALQLPVTEVPAYLGEACEGDEGLRSEVESLIAAAREPGLTLPAEILGGLSTVMSQPAPAEEGLPIGGLLSHYRIVAKIGEGGMGAVYKAEDVNLGRPVALKVISRAIITRHDKERFAREAKAASALNHPNIVTIYEFNHSAGIDFIAMEYVEGTTLDRLLAHGDGLTEDQIFDCARQVAMALEKAHAAGVVHRDLKPGNIMVARDGVVKVLDFGLAKFDTPEGRENPASLALTQAGTILGTPAYMSPEQVMGEPAGPQSDIFSFGVILYELITGSRPFPGANMAATMRQILYKDPPPIEERCEGHPMLAAVAGLCLKKEKSERPASMGEVLRMMGAPSSASVTRAGTVMATRTGFTKRGLGAGAVILAIALALFLLNWQRVAPSVGRFMSLPKSSQDWYAAGQAYLVRYDRPGNLDKAEKAFQSALQVDRRNAAAHAALAESYLMRILFRNSDRQWAKLAFDAANEAAGINPYLAIAHANRGYALLNLGKDRLDEAVGSLDRALELDPKSAAAHLYRAIAWERQGNAQRAAEFYERAVRLAPDDWRIRQRHGAFLFRSGKMPEAVAAFEKTASLVKDSAMVYSNLGAAYHASGRFEDAAAAYQRALEAHPTAAVYSNLGTLWYFLGRYSQAAEAFEKSLALDASSYLRWGNLGDACRWASGRSAKAAEAYETAIRLAREQLGRTPGDADMRSSLATYLAKNGDTGAARGELAKIDFAVVRKPNVLYKAATVEEISGARKQALELLERAVRAGYTLREIENDPELPGLRRDPEYQRMVARLAPKPTK